MMPSAFETIDGTALAAVTGGAGLLRRSRLRGWIDQALRAPVRERAERAPINELVLHLSHAVELNRSRSDEPGVKTD